VAIAVRLPDSGSEMIIFLSCATETMLLLNGTIVIPPPPTLPQLRCGGRISLIKFPVEESNTFTFPSLLRLTMSPLSRDSMPYTAPLLSFMVKIVSLPLAQVSLLVEGRERRMIHKEGKKVAKNPFAVRWPVQPVSAEWVI
jgi:hypothetical protein